MADVDYLQQFGLENWAIDSVRRRCKTPIEEMFMAAWLSLIQTGYGSSCCIGAPLEKFMALPERQPTNFLHPVQYDAMFPQQRIGKYTADFVIGRYQVDMDYSNGETEIIRRLPLIVVECDGHDFHERTKKQAQHDKERDRKFVSLGFRVLRFTGSELYRDPKKCALEVDALFQCLYSERISSAMADPF